jgi:hypothetical protein
MDPSAAVQTRRQGRPARRLLLPLLLCVPLLSGYVLPPDKVLERWFRDGAHPAVVLPALLPVRWQGRDGQLYLDPAGDHALAVEAPPPAVAAVPGRGGSKALWRSLDLLLAPDEAGAAAVLGAVGVDLTRAGYARDACSSDGVAHTLGARGEGEAGLPQVWFGRTPLRPCRLRLGADEVEIGGPGAGGWPGWFRLADGALLEVAGVPVPALSRPAWAAPSPAPLHPGSGSDSLGDWRRAFDRSGP